MTNTEDGAAKDEAGKKSRALGRAMSSDSFVFAECHLSSHLEFLPVAHVGCEHRLAGLEFLVHDRQVPRLRLARRLDGNCGHFGGVFCRLVSAPPNISVKKQHTHNHHIEWGNSQYVVLGSGRVEGEPSLTCVL